MIERKLAKELMAQFGGMPQMPTDPKDINLRLDALATYSMSGAHARAVVRNLVEDRVFFPTVADIVQCARNTVDPAGAEARSVAKACRYCNGDGYVSVDGPFGLSAAQPCDHSGHINPNLGVTMTPAQAKHYRAEQERAGERQMEWLESRKGKPQKATGFREITQADIDRVMAEKAGV